MFLDNSINGTQTTGIVLSSPQLNGAAQRFSTTSGAVLRIRYGNYREDIYTSSATINTVTNKVTLVGVTRNICPQFGRSFISCGNGRSWGKGAIVELNVDARLLNLKANVDRGNNFTASGAIAFLTNGSGSLIQPVYTTTTLRDHNLGAVPRFGMSACTSDTGLCYDGLGGAWVARGSNATANASETVAGKVQLGTILDQIAKTILGSTGAPTVVQTKYLTSSGSVHGTNDSVNAGRVLMLNSSGAISATVGGLGRVNATSGALIVAQGSGAVRLITPAPNGYFLKSNGTSWGSGTTTVTTQVVFVASSSSTSTGATSTKNFTFDTNQYTIPANTLVAGVCYEFDAYSNYTTGGSYTVQPNIQVGPSGDQAAGIYTTAGLSNIHHMSSVCGTGAAGAAVNVRIGTSYTVNKTTANSAQYSEITKATNGPILVRLGGIFGTSDASNSAQSVMLIVRKISSTGF